MRVSIILVFGIIFFISNSSLADVPKGQVTDFEIIEYSDGETKLSGYLALPPRRFSKRLPAIIIVHEWWGHGDYVRKRANMIAEELGYVAFALDMYGEGKQANHPDDAMKFSSEVSNTAGLRERRFRAALEAVSKRKEVDSSRIAAIGYCFGGSTVLDMARLDLPLAGVASFHGALGTSVDAGSVSTPIFVAHGAADSFISEEAISDFKAEMKKAAAPLTFIAYEGAKHSFTNPDADTYAKKFEIDVAYNEKADKASWAYMKKFFEPLLKAR